MTYLTRSVEVTIENAYKKSCWTVDQYIFEGVKVEYENGYRWGSICYKMTEEQFEGFLDLFPDRDPMKNDDSYNMFEFPGEADYHEMVDGCWDGIDAEFEDEDQEGRFYEGMWELDSDDCGYFITGPIKVTADFSEDEE
jgi:hypothetical protein